MRCTLLVVRGGHTVLRPFLGRPVVRRGRPSRLRQLLRLRRLLLLSCLLGGWCTPLRKGVPRAASTRSVSPRRVWQRGRASARRRLWARCWRTSAAWAYFSGLGVTAADLEPYDLVSYVMDHCLDVHPGRGSR